MIWVISIAQCDNPFSSLSEEMIFKQLQCWVLPFLFILSASRTFEHVDLFNRI